VEPGDVLADNPIASAVFARVRSVLEALGPVETRTSKTQIAFRRTRGFAYLWLPGQYLARPGADVVLSIAFGRRDPSSRFKDVVHPSPHHWMHHLEIGDASEVDDDVVRWLREAADRAD
jgi:hypothetical protein